MVGSQWFSPFFVKALGGNKMEEMKQLEAQHIFSGSSSAATPQVYNNKKHGRMRDLPEEATTRDLDLERALP